MQRHQHKKGLGRWKKRYGWLGSKHLLYKHNTVLSFQSPMVITKGETRLNEPLKNSVKLVISSVIIIYMPRVEEIIRS